MRVIAQGHAPDPRVPNPHPSHAQGQPREALPTLRLGLSTWYAGFCLGRGEDARHLLKFLVNDHDPSLEPNSVASNIFKSALLVTCQLPVAWEKLWPSVSGCIKDFLVALEDQSQATGLARRAGTILERLVLQHSQVREPLTTGTIHAVRLEVTQPISDICPPKGAERLYCIVEMEGTELGKLELPVCDGLVASWLIKDAIAAQLPGQILGRFFEHTVSTMVSGKEQLTTDNGQMTKKYDQIDWTVLLQQIWGRPDWALDRFYNPEVVEEGDGAQAGQGQPAYRGN